MSKKYSILLFLLLVILTTVILITACENDSIFDREDFEAYITIEGIQDRKHAERFIIVYDDGKLYFNENHYKNGTLSRNFSLDGQNQLTIDIINKDIEGIKGIYNPKNTTAIVNIENRYVTFTVDYQTEFSIDFANIENKGEIRLQPNKNSYDYGEKVRVELTSNDNYGFLNWSGDLSGNENPKDISIRSDIEIGAIFESPIKFKDVNLEQALREIIDIEEGYIFPSDFKDVQELDLTRNDISDLTGLSELDLSVLENLDLYLNAIEDLDGLADGDLSNLKKLSLAYNNIEDLKGLVNVDLSSLKNLDLHSNAIEDLDGLADADLRSLEYLNLGNNQITDLDGLQNLNSENLRRLTIRGNEIEENRWIIDMLKSNGVEVLE
ncbi:leucine-rich repeat domain-containing protein [Natronospora cellulosivora (SeqCode)]